jgi:DTW domain-containing protein YfiP
VEPALPDHRELCLRCRRPRSACWCHALKPISSQTHVVFIQHPREARVPVSTCRMAHLSLPNSELHVGLGAAGDAHLEALCREPDTAVLFPSVGAQDVDGLAHAPRTLIVVDGTWSNAKKVVEKCPVLSKLPRLSFKPAQPGNYRIRKEPNEHALSTIEAVAHVLERLERRPGGFVPLLSAFDAMVEKQLEYVHGNEGGSRHKHKRARNSVKVDPCAELKSRALDLVVVFGEANAWPMDAPNRPPVDDPELIQLVAARVATGERFEGLLAPRRPLSPSVPFHLDLPFETIEAAAPRAAIMAAWRAFLRPTDLLVGWGGFCRDLLLQEGEAPRDFLDLRSVLARLQSGRPGSVESVAEKMGAVLPAGRGRAVRRLESLQAVCSAAVAGQISISRQGRREPRGQL